MVIYQVSIMRTRRRFTCGVHSGVCGFSNTIVCLGDQEGYIHSKIVHLCDFWPVDCPEPPVGHDLLRAAR